MDGQSQLISLFKQWIREEEGELNANCPHPIDAGGVVPPRRVKKFNYWFRR
jgi:hypothetical protein